MVISMRKAFVEQPKSFEEPHFSNHVYRLKKALYGLKQAPRAWYERLTTFLLEKGFVRGGVDKTLFIKRDKHDVLMAQIYVDDIMFGSTDDSLRNEFAKSMSSEF